MTYDIQPSTRRCAATGRELTVGERYYSVVVEEGAELVRRDYGRDAWQGPPQGAIAVWQATVTAPDEPRRPTIHSDVLLGLMDRLDVGGEPARENLKYLVALWLVRRKLFQLLESRSEGGTSRLVFRCRRTDRRYEIPEPQLASHELKSLERQLLELLGGEGVAGT